MADRFYANGAPIPGLTDYSVGVILRSVTDNSRLSGVLASAVTAHYYRQGAAAPVAIPVVALGSADAVHADGGWREIEATIFRSWYRFDVPDAMFAPGADWVALQLDVDAAISGGFDGIYPLQSAGVIPDQILKRDWAAMVDDIANRRCMWNALRPLRNRWVLTPTAYSVKKEDDNVEAWNASVSTVAGASPVTAIDPS